MLKCDVAIVGAGPAGCAAARECTLRGLNVVLVEQKKIPRHKACSGILVPDTLRILQTHFGPIPDDILAAPADIKAMRVHFPGGPVGDVPLGGRMVWRDRFDAWLCDLSGATVFDQTRMRSFVERNDGVDLHCVQANGNPLRIQSRSLIAADGGTSRTVRRLEPSATGKMRWHIAVQDTVACRCRLEPGYFHFFAFPQIAPYLSAYVKDGFLIMEVAVGQGEWVTAAIARFRSFLSKRIRIEQARPVRRLACRIAEAAPGGSFCFGSDRILVSGEASGLLNLFGEGISPALASGIVAGQVAAEAIGGGVPPGPSYRQAIEPEKNRTLRSFQYRNILFGKGNAFDFRKGLKDLRWNRRIALLGRLLKWLLQAKACSA